MRREGRMGSQKRWSRGSRRGEQKKGAEEGSMSL